MSPSLNLLDTPAVDDANDDDDDGDDTITTFSPFEVAFDGFPSGTVSVASTDLWHG
jgi:hypothetical protein